jgi:hypothetical protein
MSFMSLARAAITAIAAGLLVVATAVPFAAAPSFRAALIPAPVVTLPGSVDSNSPVIWDLEDGQQKMFVLTSHSGEPSVSSGSELTRLGAPTEITLLPHPGYGVWMEAVVPDDVETWYGFYHNEWPATRCGRDDRFVPRVGAARSTDRGRTWEDLGVVIQARQSATACESTNRYVIGGVGDLSVMLDAGKNYLYIFYSQYSVRKEAQGVAVARIRWADRDRPSGRAEIWRDGIWDPDARRREVFPGLPGAARGMLEWIYLAASPLVMPMEAWHDGDDKVDAFWGPSVHWNTAIEQYVMLLNRAKDENYGMEGIYVSYAPRLDDPSLWSTPQKVLNGGRWYPQVVGSSLGTGTDKLAGASARFFMSGRSEWMINFSK